MPYADPKQHREATRARRKRYLERKKIEKFGVEAAGRDMRGRHGNHATGAANARWGGRRLLSSHGYVIVRVPPEHPRAFGPPRLKRFKYAYEHDVVMERILGRHLYAGEVVHHLNGRRADNRPSNLALAMSAEHAREHAGAPGARDKGGRFAKGRRRSPAGSDPTEWPEDLRVRQYPDPEEL